MPFPPHDYAVIPALSFWRELEQAGSLCLEEEIDLSGCFLGILPGVNITTFSLISIP